MERGCGSEEDSQRMPFDQALAFLLLRAAERVSEQPRMVEKVALKAALDRVLAERVQSPINVPGHENSAMDGYAFRHLDLVNSGDTKMQVIETWLAGVNQDVALTAGQCVRIMTGAALPKDADTVIAQELVERLSDGSVLIPFTRKGSHVRLAGEDIYRGEEVLAEGTVLGPAELGVLASIGVGEVSVYKPPTVAFFTTGDELRSAEEQQPKELPYGCIYDSNRYTLYGMLKRLGVDLIDMGVLPDNPDVIRKKLTSVASKADLILTCGGVSVGEADFVTQVLKEIGQVAFWKIAIRPGRPFAFGQIGSALFCGLPGNPVAVMVTFYTLVQPLIFSLLGVKNVSPSLVRAKVASDISHRPGRVEFQRGIFYCNQNNETEVKLAGEQGSGRLSSMSQANCLLLIGAELDTLKAGDWVDIIPFSGLC